MTELAGNRNVTEALARWLAGGRCKIGQLAVESSGTKFELRHVDEMDRADLETHRGTIAARHLANLDDADRFRPLKTAPNLRHGWRLILRDVDELRVALDYFYPAMLGVALSHERGELRSVPLRETSDGKGGSWSTPALDRELVYVATNAGGLVAVERGTGKLRWEIPLPGPTWSSPVVVDNVLIQGDCAGELHAYDVSDQRRAPPELWSVALGGCIEAPPAVWRGRIYVGTRAGAMMALGDRPR